MGKTDQRLLAFLPSERRFNLFAYQRAPRPRPTTGQPRPVDRLPGVGRVPRVPCNFVRGALHSPARDPSFSANHVSSRASPSSNAAAGRASGKVPDAILIECIERRRRGWLGAPSSADDARHLTAQPSPSA